MFSKKAPTKKGFDLGPLEGKKRKKGWFSRFFSGNDSVPTSSDNAQPSNNDSSRSPRQEEIPRALPRPAPIVKRENKKGAGDSLAAPEKTSGHKSSQSSNQSSQGDSFSREDRSQLHAEQIRRFKERQHNNPFIVETIRGDISPVTGEPVRTSPCFLKPAAAQSESPKPLETREVLVQSYQKTGTRPDDALEKAVISDGSSTVSYNERTDVIQALRSRMMEKGVYSSDSEDIFSELSNSDLKQMLEAL
jgi:hypothetical protein